ncbi:hypothetical protein [Desulfallas thermosapovorans]|uniref:Uncharacterized protein n=1 Tax=Desulfallas thermosapovorans DSM 6562 TaxID=1121431 RepID=A0A5S4ZRI5_9FIRM|nr:hypothetical protein [Desulfallas thermosapovorans]TYO94705.1 hypothetical protein LX24_02174 [Desulfallas thermosapovorans DSM 6562]
MFDLLILLAVTLISIHVASYGWYALHKEKKLRGAVGAFVVAGATLAAPVLLMLYYALAG